MCRYISTGSHLRHKDRLKQDTCDQYHVIQGFSYKYIIQGFSVFWEPKLRFIEFEMRIFTQKLYFYIEKTAWNDCFLRIVFYSRTRMGQGLLHRAHRAALRCRTTRCGSCRQCRPRRRSRRRSPASLSSGPATPACPRPPSSRSTQLPGDAQQSPRRIINARITIGFNSNENLRMLRSKTWFILMFRWVLFYGRTMLFIYFETVSYRKRIYLVSNF